MQHKKIVGILYIPGAAGGILTRILQAHKESYWNSDWLNHDNLDITSPLEFPSNPPMAFPITLAPEDLIILLLVRSTNVVLSPKSRVRFSYFLPPKFSS